MSKLINVVLNGFKLKAVMISKEQSTPDVWNNTFYMTILFYCQNRLAKKIKYYIIHPEDGSYSLTDETVEILVDYCVIPEYDKLLK